MKILKRKNKLYNYDRFNIPEIRVYHKKGTKRKSSHYILKCGCCNQKLEIFYDSGFAGGRYKDNCLEINGIYGHIDDWKEILLPLLGV